ncbi:MAG: hypothetical protein ACREL1_07725 [bacterium]
MFYFFLVLAGSGLAIRAKACSVCGCGDPLASAGDARPLVDTFHLSLESVYLTASAQSDDDATQNEAVRQTNLNATLTYSLTNDLSLSLMLPLEEKYWTLSAGDAPAVAGGTLADTGTPFGLGDILVGARYFFLSETDLVNKEHTGLAVSGGVYVPTGGTNFKSGITGDNLDTHSQLGTGAWGFYGGLLFNQICDNFTFSANANLVVRTTPGTANTDSPVYQYTFGNAFTGGVEGRLEVTDTLALSLAVEGRYADPDRELNDSGDAIINTPSTGGTVLDATPGVWWNLSGDSTLYAKVQLPFYTGLDGVQEVDPTYTMGTQFLIH